MIWFDVLVFVVLLFFSPSEVKLYFAPSEVQHFLPFWWGESQRLIFVVWRRNYKMGLRAAGVIGHKLFLLLS
jgi:hypothetical protein